jgi:hypothetical protein
MWQSIFATCHTGSSAYMGFDATHAKFTQAEQIAEKPSGVSFRAERGIPLRFKSKKREIPHPQERVPNDSFLVFPHTVKPMPLF